MAELGFSADKIATVVASGEGVADLIVAAIYGD
jgi:hypothetical protein